MSDDFTLSRTWQILGPFPIGTREQQFGADPLENYGESCHQFEDARARVLTISW